jgi:peroxiredoxin
MAASSDASAPSPLAGDRLTVGGAAPEIDLPDPEGRRVRLDPRSHPASVVVFTANGCPYARAWHDRIQAVAHEYAERDVPVLQIVSNEETDHPEDSLSAMRERVENGELAGPFLRDGDQAVARAFGATATPEIFVIDGTGIVRYHGAPDGDYDDPAQDAKWLRAALDDVLAGRSVAHPRTFPAGCSIKWRVDLLWWDGCPSHERAQDMLATTLAELGREDVAVGTVQVTTFDEARRLGLPGSPTFQVGRRDLFPADAAPSLTCRVYTRSDGRSAPLPEAAELAARLREALARPWDLPQWIDHRKPGPGERTGT